MHLQVEERIHRRLYALLHGIAVLLFFSGIYSLFFLPDLLSNKLLAPGDALIQSVPPFYAPRTLWTSLIWGGFPLAADVTPQTWYPLSLLFAALKSWNSFVVSAYVLASSFTYGYIHELTRSKFAACISGLIFGLSGFMIAHLGHTSMIHSAAWIPLIIWSLEKLKSKFQYRWLIAGALGVSLCFLGGHPQIFVYGIGLSIFFSIFTTFQLEKQRWLSYAISVVSVFGVGVALSAIQLIPTVELASLTPRAAISFNMFLEYSLPQSHFPLFIFPYGLGSAAMPPYEPFYLGRWNLTEMTVYVGLVPLLLALIGILGRNNGRSKYFFACAALISLLLVFGDLTPLAWLTHKLPGYNKFRVLARHGVILAFSISVLSGLGISELQKRNVSFKRLKRLSLFSAAIFTAAAAGLLATRKNAFDEYRDVVNSLNLQILPGLAVLIPCTILVIGLISLFAYRRNSKSPFIACALCCVIILDLGSFGWFYNTPQLPSSNALNDPNFVSEYIPNLEKHQQRLISVRGGVGDADEVIPNMSLLWGAPNMSGYGPLQLMRMKELLSMPPHGSIPDSWRTNTRDKSLDLSAVKYALAPSYSETQLRKGKQWNNEELNLALGEICVPEPTYSAEMPVEMDVSGKSVSATELSVISYMGCSISIPQGEEIAEITIQDEQGNIETLMIRAGVDTSEWAYDCEDVLSQIQHERAPVFDSFTIPRQEVETQVCTAHSYVSQFEFSKKIEQIKSVQIKWTGQVGALHVVKSTLTDSDTDISYPLTHVLTPSWQYAGTSGEAVVYENQNALPRAWLVSDVVHESPENILETIKTSTLPNGEIFDPHITALVEQEIDDFPNRSEKLDQASSVGLDEVTSTHLIINTQAAEQSFLVLADAYYPGWSALVDGEPTPIFQTNYAFRGVSLPPGEHTVEFMFRPISFRLGLAVSASSAALLLLSSLVNPKKW